MAGPSAWTFYNDFKLNLGLGLLDVRSDVFRVALFDAASSAGSTSASPATYAAFAADGHEVPNGNGYQTAGKIAGSPTWVGGGAVPTLTFDVADVSWSALGVGFVARFAVLYDDTAVPNAAVAFTVLDSAPADVVVDPGNTLAIEIVGVCALT